MSSSFRPETGVPIPARATNSKGYTAAVRALKPGESVLLPIKTGHASYIVGYICNGARGLKRSDFACRRESDGARIWRLDPAAAA